MIQVKNLSARYGNDFVFKNISFSLKENTFTALCGKNGSGKSTLLSLLDGIIPDGLSLEGEILIDNKNVFSFKRNELAKKVSYLVQNENPVWNMSVDQFIQTGLYSFEGISQSQRDIIIDESLKKLDILFLKEKNIFNISGGEFQKCRLARCLVQKSDILLFDEPSENLDLPFQAQLMSILKNFSKGLETKSVLFSIHDINMAAAFCEDFILFSKDGILVESRENIFKKEILENAFDSKVKIFIHPELNVPQVLFL